MLGGSVLGDHPVSSAFHFFASKAYGPSTELGLQGIFGSGAPDIEQKIGAIGGHFCAVANNADFHCAHEFVGVIRFELCDILFNH